MASKLRHWGHKNERVSFSCPGCGWPHDINVAVNPAAPNRPVWTWNGSDEKPTFSPSILVTGGELNGICHSFVRDGQIQFLSDCKHALAGKLWNCQTGLNKFQVQMNNNGIGDTK